MTTPMPKRRRRQLATAELVMAVSASYAVTEPGNEAHLAQKYDLTARDMERIRERIGDQLEAWAMRLGYDDIPDDDDQEAR